MPILPSFSSTLRTAAALRTTAACLLLASLYLLPTVASAQSAAEQKDLAAVAAALSIPRQEFDAAIAASFFPPTLKVPTPGYEVVEIIEAEDHQRWRINFITGENETVPAYLLIPKPLPQKGQKLPLLLVLHGTTPLGKDVTLQPFNAEESQRWGSRGNALALVREGFVVFAPDRAAFGERRLLKNGTTRAQMDAWLKRIQAEHPEWSLVGKAVWDLQRALDFLVTLPFVDAERIGSIGHSLGSWDTLFITAADKRIKAAVMNHGNTLRFNPQLWANEQALRKYLARMKERSTPAINADMNVYLMAIAPRAQLFFWSLEESKDSVRPNMLDAARPISTYNQAVAKRDNAPFEYAFYLHTKGHDFRPESRALAYRWLKDRLMGESPSVP